MLSHAGLFAALQTRLWPARLLCPRPEYWSGFPVPSSRDIPDPGIKPASPVLEADSLPLSHEGYSHIKEQLYKDVDEDPQRKRRPAGNKPVSRSSPSQLSPLSYPVELTPAMCAVGSGLQFWSQKHKPESEEGRGLGGAVSREGAQQTGPWALALLSYHPQGRPRILASRGHKSPREQSKGGQGSQSRGCTVAGGALGQGPARTHESSCVQGRAGPARSAVAEPT